MPLRTSQDVRKRLGSLAVELASLRQSLRKPQAKLDRARLLGDLIDKEQKVLRQLGELLVKTETADALRNAEERIRMIEDSRVTVRDVSAFEALEKSQSDPFDA